MNRRGGASLVLPEGCTEPASAVSLGQTQYKPVQEAEFHPLHNTKLLGFYHITIITSCILSNEC